MPQSMSKTAFLDKVGTSFNFYKFTYWLYCSESCIFAIRIYILYYVLLLSTLGSWYMCKWYVLYLLSLLWRRSGGTLPLSVGKLTHLNARSRLSLWFEDRSRVTFPSKWRIACCIFSSAWIYLKVCSIANNSEKNMCVVKFFSDIAYKVCNLQKKWATRQHRTFFATLKKSSASDTNSV